MLDICPEMVQETVSCVKTRLNHHQAKCSAKKINYFFDLIRLMASKIGLTRITIEIENNRDPILFTLQLIFRNELLKNRQIFC